MAARHAELFTVSSMSDIEELERVLTDETSGSSGSITIDIPDGATTFFNARDFRRLLQATRASETELLVRTDDPLRRELARIIGIEVAPGDPLFHARESSRAVLASEPIQSVTVERLHMIGAPVEVEPDTTPDPIPQPSVPNDQTTTQAPIQLRRQPVAVVPDNTDTLDESEASFSFVITPPVPRRAHHITDTATSPSATSLGAPRREGRATETQRGRPRSRTGHSARRRLIGLAVIVLTLMALVAVAFGLILPTATITVTPEVTAIEASLTYGLDTPGATWDILLAPVPLSTTLTFSASGPTSGERFEPDATATGLVLLTNATTVNVTVSAGTPLASENGIDVVTTEEIVVPAADPYGSLTFGSMSVPVRAEFPGPDGNLAADAVYGQLDNGIFYTNRDPLTGGTSRRIPVVTQSDLDALEQQARANLEGQAVVALTSTLQPNQQLVEDSERWSSVEATFDREARDDAATVRIDATMSVSGQAFDSSTWHDDAREEVGALLQTQVGTDREFIDGSLELSEPDPIAESNAAFRVRSTARVRSNINMAQLEGLRNVLANATPDEAVARIQQIDGIDGVRVEQHNDWLTSDLPRLTSRITIEVVDAEGISP